jgi:outer membrane protein OmpA-like peptidoglycan-associated protein
MELHYQVNNGQLDASNTVLLEQLQLGEKVASADAIDLPVRLAVAMLKDTKGNISIQLPVKGDLNSPEFSVMPIVWQTLRNLLTRAVSSPFRMLASIGKAGDKDLGQIPFTAGSAELQADAAGLLDNLATALLERPMLQLNIEGTSAQALDGPALAERVLQRRYQELTYRHLQERGKPLPKDIYSIEVPEKSRDKLLEEIYATMLAEGKVAAMPSMPRKERHDWQRQQVLKHMAGDPLFLRWLAQQRAAAIRAHLVEHGGIDVERLYLVDVNEKTEAENMVVYSQLHLDVL